MAGDKNRKRVENAKKKVNRDFIEKGASGVTDDDFKKVTDRADEIRAKFEKGGPLGRFINDVKLMISIVKDYANGNYREIPYLTVGAIVFALIYVLSPIDLIPDFIPVVGYVDDAAVVGLCLIMVEQDLHDYKAWKVEHAGESA
jgi:uncharacterized membrane protein YkvA (DUF1232 family)